MEWNELILFKTTQIVNTQSSRMKISFEFVDITTRFINKMHLNKRYKMLQLKKFQIEKKYDNFIKQKTNNNKHKEIK